MDETENLKMNKGLEQILITNELQLLDLLQKKESKYLFFKKEVLLIGLMAIFTCMYLFSLNEWQNKIAFSGIFLTLILVTFKLFDIFSSRKKKYEELIQSLSEYIKPNQEVLYTKKTAENYDWTERYDEELIFSLKILPAIEKFEKSINNDIDPMNSPISDLLKERADERRRKMKVFNYQFKNANIDEIEKVPAYKRNRVTIDVDDTDDERFNEPREIEEESNTKKKEQ